MSDCSFTPQKIDAAYVNTLVDFINACRLYGTKLEEIRFFQNGWHVTFADCPHADAVCHDGSYGSPCYGAIIDESAHSNDWESSGSWETIGFPWDDDDVSVHDGEELAAMISAYQSGQDWHVPEE